MFAHNVNTLFENVRKKCVDFLHKDAHRFKSDAQNDGKLAAAARTVRGLGAGLPLKIARAKPFAVEPALGRAADDALNGHQFRLDRPAVAVVGGLHHFVGRDQDRAAAFRVELEDLDGHAEFAVLLLSEHKEPGGRGFVGMPDGHIAMRQGGLARIPDDACGKSAWVLVLGIHFDKVFRGKKDEIRKHSVDRVRGMVYYVIRMGRNRRYAQPGLKLSDQEWAELQRKIEAKETSGESVESLCETAKVSRALYYRKRKWILEVVIPSLAAKQESQSSLATEAA